MPRKITRSIDFFALHCSQEGGQSEFPYSRLFTAFSDLEPRQRIFEQDEQVIAFPVVRKFSDGFLLRSVEGPRGLQPVILDTLSGQARTEALRDDEVLTEFTHAIVFPDARRVAVEYNRRGAKAKHLAMAVEGIVRANVNAFRYVNVQFSPLISGDFLEEIESLERVRSVSFTITKPNAGWSDHYIALSDWLDESNGDKAEMTVRAPRGESLQKSSGILQTLKELVLDSQPYLLAARVLGKKTNADAETSIPLKEHVVRERVTVAVGDNGQVVTQELGAEMAALLRQKTRG